MTAVIINRPPSTRRWGHVVPRTKKQYVVGTGTPTETFLSNLDPVLAINVYGPYERDLSNGEQEPGDGLLIRIGPDTYYKGLGTHADARLVYNLSGNYTRFRSFIGVDYNIKPEGRSIASVVFSVILNGSNTIYTSPVMGWSTPAISLDLNITGAATIELRVDGVDGIAYDWADWAEARIISQSIRPSYVRRRIPRL